MKLYWMLVPALLLSACQEPVVEAEPVRPAQVWEVTAQIAASTERYSGEIEARQVVNHAFRVAGKLLARPVEIGDIVSKGQELAQLDDTDSRLSVDQSASGVQASLGTLASVQSNLNSAQGTLVSARANRVAAQAGLESAQTAVETARANANAAQASVGVADAEVQNAQLEYKRSAKLVQQGYASTAVMDRDTQRLNTANANLKSAQASAAAAQSQVQAAQSRVKTSQAQIQAAEGEIESATANTVALQGQIHSAQAQVNSQQNQLKLVKNQSGYTSLASTIDGIVTATSAESGQVVGAGQTIVSIARAGELDVHIRVGEQAIKSLQPDMPAQISLWADQNIELQGKVREISPAADAHRTWLVKIALEPMDEQVKDNVRLGMTAKVTFSKTLPESMVWLPATALFQQDKQSAIWVVDKDNQVALRNVNVERYLHDGLLVTGLETGLKIIAAGVNRIHTGQNVLPVPYNGQASPAGQ